MYLFTLAGSGGICVPYHDIWNYITVIFVVVSFIDGGKPVPREKTTCLP
jgi:hypothetical protein